MIQHRQSLWAVVLLGLTMMPAQAATSTDYPPLTLPGSAVTGSDSRDVQVEISCSTNDGPMLTGVLTVKLYVPNAEQLKRSFDFEPFEGPDAIAGPLSQLTSIVDGASAQGTFGAAGFVPGEPTTSFVLEVSAAMRREAARLAALSRVLRPLTRAPGTLQWRQGNFKKSGLPIMATVDVSASVSSSLKTILAPCLGTGSK